MAELIVPGVAIWAFILYSKGVKGIKHPLIPGSDDVRIPSHKGSGSAGDIQFAYDLGRDFLPTADFQTLTPALHEDQALAYEGVRVHPKQRKDVHGLIVKDGEWGQPHFVSGNVQPIQYDYSGDPKGLF